MCQCVPGFQKNPLRVPVALFFGWRCTTIGSYRNVSEIHNSSSPPKTLSTPIVYQMDNKVYKSYSRCRPSCGNRTCRPKPSAFFFIPRFCNSKSLYFTIDYGNGKRNVLKNRGLHISHWNYYYYHCKRYRCLFENWSLGKYEKRL